MKATYYQSDRAPVEMDVESHNKDAETADLAVDGEIKVSGCPVSSEGKPGTCSLFPAAKEAKEANKPQDEKNQAK